jgi:hypothetical protein
MSKYPNKKLMHTPRYLYFESRFRETDTFCGVCKKDKFWCLNKAFHEIFFKSFLHKTQKYLHKTQKYQFPTKLRMHTYNVDMYAQHFVQIFFDILKYFVQ